MDPVVALSAAVVGYLLGSISFARLVAHAVDPTADVTRIETSLGEGVSFTSDSVSATAVRMKVGRRYGILTAVLDMGKVALPTLVFRLAFPDQPYHLIVAATGLIGHDWPIYHRFLGGRGETAIYGALLVIDPAGVVVTLILGMGLGFLLGNILVFRWAGMILLIPWFWIARGDPALVAYMVFADAVYLFAMRPELSQYFGMRHDQVDPTNEEIADEFGMGARLGRAIDRYGLPGLISRLRSPAS